MIEDYYEEYYDLTDEQNETLDRIADTITAQGEEAGASDARIRAEIRNAQDKYLKKIGVI